LPPGSNLRWLTGADLHADERACLMLITPSDAVFLIPALEAEACRASTDLPFETWTDAEGPHAALARIMQHFGIASAARIDLDEAMRADHALMLLDMIPGAGHGFAGSTIGQLRMIKSPSDYAALKRSAAVADAVLASLVQTLTVGLRESDVADMIRDAFKTHSAKPEFAIVGAGENGAKPHHEGGDRRIKDGDVLVIDIGGRVDGMPSDITRSFVIGSPPDDYLAIHTLVDQAVEAALAMARPGVRACDVDHAARSVIAQAGYGAFFTHRTGHGLGLDLHEPPYITASSDQVLREGMVFSIEPGIYLPGRFGVRLEEIVFLTATHAEILSGFMRSPILISL
jgi:Xaa-Pro aminopeptidase